MNIDHSLVGTERGYILDVNFSVMSGPFPLPRGGSKLKVRDEKSYKVVGNAKTMQIKRGVEGKTKTQGWQIICDFDSFLDPTNITEGEKALVIMTGDRIGKIERVMIDIGSEMCKACSNKISHFELEIKIREMLKALENL